MVPDDPSAYYLNTTHGALAVAPWSRRYSQGHLRRDGNSKASQPSCPTATINGADVPKRWVKLSGGAESDSIKVAVL